PLGGLPDAHQRGAQVAVDVVGEGLEGRDVEHPASLLLRGEGLVEEPVDGPQESGQRLARAGGGVDQCVVTGGDRLPAAALGWRRSGEARLEPGPRGGGEAVEDGHSAERIPGAGQPKGRAQVQQVSSPEGRAASTFSQISARASSCWGVSWSISRLRTSST